jgi:hypothetical protein
MKKGNVINKDRSIHTFANQTCVEKLKLCNTKYGILNDTTLCFKINKVIPNYEWKDNAIMSKTAM